MRTVLLVAMIAGAYGTAHAQSADSNSGAASEAQEACTGLGAGRPEANVFNRLNIVEVKRLMSFSGDGDNYEKVAGATILVRGDGPSAGRLQQLLDCHIAEAKLGGDESGDPLAVQGVRASIRPFGPGYRIDLTAGDAGTPPADEVWSRASHIQVTQ
jgi:hypothetical protein